MTNFFGRQRAEEALDLFTLMSKLTKTQTSSGEFDILSERNTLKMRRNWEEIRLKFFEKLFVEDFDC